MLDGEKVLSNKEPSQDWQSLIKWIFLSHKLPLILMISFSIISGSFGTINSYLIKLVIDTVQNTNNQKLVTSIFWPALMYALNFEVHHLLWRGINYINLNFIPIMRTEITNYVLSYTYKNSYGFFKDRFGGTISKYITSLNDELEILSLNLVFPIIRGLAQIFFVLISMYFINPWFSIVISLWVIFFGGISLIRSNKIRPIANKHSKNHADLSGKIIDSITNAVNIILFSRGNYEINQIQPNLLNVSQSFKEREKFTLKFMFWQGLSITFLIALILVILVNLKIKNLVTTGDFAFILSLILYVTDNVWFITNQINRVHNIIAKCDQSLKHIFLPHEVEDIINPRVLSVHKGEISFRKVKFSYDDRLSTLEIDNLTIHGGEKVGLVGLSGEGKTTFVNLILRLFDVDTGHIFIDGQEIKKVTQHSLRSSISVVPQDPILFHRSLLENIRYGKPDASPKEVIKASIKTHAHSFIKNLPKGYSTVVGERGIKLSGGQRQRVAIARALLKNAPIIIFDEATSQLDSITEENMQNIFYEDQKNKTTIIISHRLSTLLKMDRILVFHEGKIIEKGAHKSLLKNNGIYKSMWDKQVNGFL